MSSLTQMNLQDVIEFVSQNEGQFLPAIGGRAKFYVRKAGDKAFVFITQAGTPRNENHVWIGKSLEVLNRTGSFKIKDYPHTVNASYVLGLFWQIIVHQQGLQTLPPTLQIEEKEVLVTKKTEQEELRKSRLGQGKFRKQLLRLRKSCYVTEISDERLLRASHIKPWKDSNNSERLDPFNGLPLTPNYDALFDQGLISFHDDGRIIISNDLRQQIITALGIDKQFKGTDLGIKTKAYLAHHRNHKFRGKLPALL